MVKAQARAITRRPYSDLEEWLHTLTHGLGAALSIAALVFMILKAQDGGGAARMTAAVLYGSSMIVLYLASTLYHGTWRTRVQPLFKVIDHSAIYVKIAGTYTPFALLILPGATGLMVLITSWVTALTGIAFKVAGHFQTGPRRWKGVSLALYLVMGWGGILVIDRLFANLSGAGFAWLLAGGAAFTIGAIFYAFEKMPFGHTIWHIFVLAGSACHFVAIYGYVI